MNKICDYQLENPLKNGFFGPYRRYMLMMSKMVNYGFQFWNLKNLKPHETKKKHFLDPDSTAKPYFQAANGETKIPLRWWRVGLIQHDHVDQHHRIDGVTPMHVWVFRFWNFYLADKKIANFDLFTDFRISKKTKMHPRCGLENLISVLLSYWRLKTVQWL